MKKRKVIAQKNLKTRLPLFQTLVTWIALDYWHAPQWLWGAVGLFYLVIWAFCLYDIGKNNDEEIDIFDDGVQNNLPKFKNPPPPPKSWKDRIEEEMKKDN